MVSNFEWAFLFVGFLKMFCWADIINDNIYAINCLIIYNVYGSHSSFLHQLNLYQHVYSLIFVLARWIFCNIIAVHITDLFLFLNLTKFKAH